MGNEEIIKKGKQLRLASIIGGIVFALIGLAVFLVMLFDNNPDKPIAVYVFPVMAWVISIIVIIAAFRPYEVLVKENEEYEKKKYNKKHATEIAENEIKNSLFQLNFTTTNSVGFDKSKILIDNNSKQWCIQSNNENHLSVSQIMKFTDILSFEIMDNSSTVYKTKVEGGITRAIVGGVGALVGANTAGSSTRSQTNHSYKVLFMVNDINNPTISFNCLNDLDMAKQVAATFEVIKYNN